jgi:hypothetical protein
MRESELVSVMNRHLKENKLIYANEVRMGIGIPDVVVGYNLSEEHESIVDYYELRVYCLIIEKNITNIKEVIKFSTLPKAQIIKYVHLLEEKNIISINDEAIIINKRLDKKSLGINISIEAKIRDWRSGLIQAQRYLSFSDYSYVALPEKNIKNVESQKFTDSGIGLLSISDNDIQEIISPVKSGECDYFFKYISISSLLEKCEDVIDGCNKFCALFPFDTMECRSS